MSDLDGVGSRVHAKRTVTPTRQYGWVAGLCGVGSDRRPAPGVASSAGELPLLLTVDEVARLLRIGRNGAYAAVASGAIPSVRIGRTIRVPRDALLERLAATIGTTKQR